MALAASVSSATLCPLLSARLLIPVSLELLLYPISIFTAVGAVALLIAHDSKNRGIWTLRNLASALVGTVVVLLVLGVWHRSNDLFFGFSTARMSEQTRKTLDKEMTSLGERQFRSVSGDAVQLVRQDLPPIFRDTVGLDSEFAYGLAQKDQSGVINVGVAYGYKARRWGVFRGAFIANKWPHARTCRLYGETFYFVTTDY